MRYKMTVRVEIPEYLTGAKAATLATKRLRAFGRVAKVRVEKNWSGDIRRVVASIVTNGYDYRTVTAVEKSIRGAFLGSRPLTPEELEARKEAAQRAAETRRLRTACNHRIKLAERIAAKMLPKSAESAGVTSNPQDENVYLSFIVKPHRLGSVLKQLDRTGSLDNPTICRHFNNYQLTFEIAGFQLCQLARDFEIEEE